MPRRCCCTCRRALDYPHSLEAKCRLGVELGLLPWGSTSDDEGVMDAFLAEHLVLDLEDGPGRCGPAPDRRQP